jgi:hypothetical protein
MAGPAGPPPGLFVSPFGELFLSEPGEPWPTQAWFRGADTDGDGRLTFPEFRADGMRVFAALDLNADGRIGPPEQTAYEQGLAEANARMPGLRPPSGAFRGAPPGGFPSGFPGTRPPGLDEDLNLASPAGQQMPGGGMGGPGGGMRGGPPSGGGMMRPPRMRAPTGPFAYGPIAAAGFFNYPQPVKAADLDVNQFVTGEEWARASERWFTALDTDTDGALTLPTLPRTPLQAVVEDGRLPR